MPVGQLGAFGIRPYYQAVGRTLSKRLLIGSHGPLPRGPIRFLMAYSDSTPQAASRPNLTFPMKNFRIGVFYAQSKNPAYGQHSELLLVCDSGVPIRDSIP